MSFRSTAKRMICRLAHALRLPAKAARRLGTDVVILTYHSFSEAIVDGPTHRLPIGEFERQLDFLERHFQIVSMSEAVAELASGGPPRSPANDPGQSSQRPKLVLTVDDGFRDNHSLLLPVLRSRGLPTTVFVATDFVDFGRPPWPTELGEVLSLCHDDGVPGQRRRDLFHEWSRETPERRHQLLDELRHEQCAEGDRSPALTWVQLREMESAGIEVGSHTAFHSVLPKMTDEVLEREVSLSRLRIEAELEGPCRYFSYPNGDWDQRCLSQVAAAGYEAAVTQDWGSNDSSSDLMALRRIQVNHNEPLEVFACRATLLLRPFGGRERPGHKS